jgi:hypothetical protein
MMPERNSCKKRASQYTLVHGLGKGLTTLGSEEFICLDFCSGCLSSDKVDES